MTECTFYSAKCSVKFLYKCQVAFDMTGAWPHLPREVGSERSPLDTYFSQISRPTQCGPLEYNFFRKK